MSATLNKFDRLIKWRVADDKIIFFPEVHTQEVVNNHIDAEILQVLCLLWSDLHRVDRKIAVFL